MQNLIKSKYIFPIFYSVAILGMVIYQLNEQNVTRTGGNSPFFQNLMEKPAYARKGFDPDKILKVPLADEEWVQFQSPPLRIKNSQLPDLPKRKYLSPWGTSAEEFTIIIPVDFDSRTLSILDDDPSIIPGVYLGYIGENWEVYLNGNLVRTEVHLDKYGQIKSHRSWRDVYFPLEKNHFVPGTNVLAFRIIGDPALGVTGFYYAAPYYIDNYNTIKLRHQSFILMILCGIFAYTGIYYLLLFFSIRKKEEVFNLYYSLFSFLLFFYSISGSELINYIIPNSEISIRIEFASLFIMVPMLCCFIEQIGRQKITIITKVYFIFSAILSITQIFFCTQYGAEVLMIWSVSVLAYLTYVFFYDIFYFYFWEQRRSGLHKRGSDTFISILIGSVLVYACGIYDLLDVVLFFNGLRLFLYSTFVFHIGMAFTLSSRFRAIHNRLETSNIILKEKTQTVLDMQDALLTTMAEMVEHRDDITGGHIERTKRWVKILLNEMETSEVYAEQLKGIDLNLILQSCQLHDVGKITITDNILRKPEKLNDDEYEEMKKHTIFGEHIIGKSERHAKETNFLKYAKIFAVSHHEKWDGTGYPYGLKGNDIPLLGRIMAIADVYDALISVRPYKPALTHEEAVQMINENSGTQFDPELVEIFNKVADKFKE